MKNKITKSILMLLLLSVPVFAFAAIELKTVVETEVTEKDKTGKTITKRVAAKKVVPGTEVIYTISAKNTGKKVAENIMIKDPIPEHMRYVDGSAFGAGTAISFSVDGGKTYNKPGKLTIKNKAGKSRPATSDDYTHIRWALQFKLKPGQVAPVWFKAKLK